MDVDKTLENKELNKYKRFFTILLTIQILLSILGIVECLFVEYIEPYRHAILWDWMIFYNGIFLFFTRKLTSFAVNKVDK